MSHAQKTSSVFWDRPVTGWGCFFIVASVYLLWALSPLVKVGGDYISDAYHISRVEHFVKKAARLQSHSTDPQSQKRAVIRMILDMAHNHNNKLRRRVKSSAQAINALDVESLRLTLTYSEKRS